MTHFNTWILIASALMAPEGIFLEKPTLWYAINEQQEIFLNHFSDLKEDCSLLNTDELQSWASQNHTELNTIAAEQQVPITFEPFAENEFGSLSVMSLNLQWLKKPVQTSCMFKNVRSNVDALLFSKNFEIFNADDRNCVVKIKTLSGDVICLSMVYEGDMDEFDFSDPFVVAHHIANIREDLEDGRFCDCDQQDSDTAYNAVVIPEFAYEGFVDVSWLNGMKCGSKKKNDEYSINQATKYVKLTFDVDGCQAQAGVGVSFMPISSLQKLLPIDAPFLFWVERPGCENPIIEGFVDGGALKG